MVLAAVLDITDRKEKEEALLRSQERFRRAVESAPNAMVMVSRRGRIEMLNFEAERLFGYPREELLGRFIEVLVPERFHKQHPGLRMSYLADPRSRPMGAGRDLYGLRKDGTEFPVEIGLNPIETDDGPMVLAAIVDITERKRKEERLQAALEGMEVVLGETHHRIKNNLQIVASVLNLHSAKIRDETALDIFRDCQNRIQSISLIHETLYQSNNFAKVEFAPFINSLVAVLKDSYDADSNRIAVSVDAEHILLPTDVAISCGQVVNELIINAFKHAFPDGREGTIAVSLVTDSRGDVILSVSDDGIGIPNSVEKTQASTVGLRLVRLLTEQLNGSLAIREKDPARFILQFPGEICQIRPAAEKLPASS